MTSTFLPGRVWQHLTEAARASQQPANVAVAYLGAGGSNLLPLPPGSALVVDAGEGAVSSGQTCPMDLEIFLQRGARVYSFLDLHAKVFVFDHCAFIGSTNVSYRSSTRLIEAIVRVQSRREVNLARGFVRGLCLHELDLTAIPRLQRIYRPPLFSSSGSNPASSRVLIMELTGESRVTQVQPPKPVWTEYFRIDVDHPNLRLPTIRLRDATTQTEVARPVVYHDHNWTIEIVGAKSPRPAILRMRRLGRNYYEYSVFKRSDTEFQQLTWDLENYQNPLRTHGRRWFVM